MKKTPLLIGFIAGSLALTAAGFAGKDNIYAFQSPSWYEVPLMNTVFTGIHDGVMPWDLFSSEKRMEAESKAEEQRRMEQRLMEQRLMENSLIPTPDPIPTPTLAPTPTPLPIATSTPAAVLRPTPSPTPTPEPTYTPRYEPLRETTYEEYINHVSADIYGMDGVMFAQSADFTDVDETYFDDALFIGDSRTVGLKKYTDISDHADFRCVTSQTVYKALTSDFAGAGTLEKTIKAKQYSKIYIMLGVNELGSGTTEDYIKSFTELVDTILEWSPNSKIILQGIMKVDRSKSDSDKVFNNSNIQARNNALATLADNDRVFYIDVNEAVCDEDGYLRDNLTYDHLHLLGKSNEIWKQFLLSHGIDTEKNAE